MVPQLPATIPRPEDLYIHAERCDAVCVIGFSSRPTLDRYPGRLICPIWKRIYITTYNLYMQQRVPR